MTEDELRREIAAAEGRKAQAETEIELLRQLLELHSGRDRSNIAPMLQVGAVDTRSKGVKIMAKRSRDLTPSRLACIEAELSDPMIAKLTKCGRSTVQAWHSGLRPVPLVAAKLLASQKQYPDGHPKAGKPMIPLHVWKRIQE